MCLSAHTGMCRVTQVGSHSGLRNIGSQSDGSQLVKYTKGSQRGGWRPPYSEGDLYILLNKFSSVRPFVYKLYQMERPGKEEEEEILVLDLVPI